VDDGSIRCTECGRAVDEFTAIAEHWGFWSDGCGELLPYCPECADGDVTQEFVFRVVRIEDAVEVDLTPPTDETNTAGADRA
jgi:hypothetical protein